MQEDVVGHLGHSSHSHRLQVVVEEHHIVIMERRIAIVLVPIHKLTKQEVVRIVIVVVLDTVGQLVVDHQNSEFNQ